MKQIGPTLFEADHDWACEHLQENILMAEECNKSKNTRTDVQIYSGRMGQWDQTLITLMASGTKVPLPHTD